MQSIATTIRLTHADKKVIEKLEEITGLRRSQIIRVALRRYLRAETVAFDSGKDEGKCALFNR